VIVVVLNQVLRREDTTNTRARYHSIDKDMVSECMRRIEIIAEYWLNVIICLRGSMVTENISQPSVVSHRRQ